MLANKKLIEALEQGNKYVDIWDGYGGFKIETLFCSLFTEFPNLFSMEVAGTLDGEKVAQILTEKYSNNDYFYLITKTYQKIKNKKTVIDDENEDYSDNASCVIILDKNLIFEQYKSAFKIHYRGIPEEEIKNISKLITDNCIIKNNKAKFHVIAKNGAGLYLADFAPIKQNIEIDINYNDDFKPINNIITDFLGNENSGIIILHGKPGTGKTSYIRHLMSQELDNSFIYVTVDMMHHLSSPDFIPFILQYPNSILILEDCEELLKKRNTTSYINSGLINILEMSDGLLGDALKLKFICTFNADLKDIDEAISRKGRLIAEYEFKELTKNKVKLLNEKHDIGIPDDEIKDMTIGDVFHYKSMGFIKEKKRIGF
jgi:hypothetical protein